MDLSIYEQSKVVMEKKRDSPVASHPFHAAMLSGPPNDLDETGAAPTIRDVPTFADGYHFLCMKKGLQGLLICAP